MSNSQFKVLAALGLATLALLLWIILPPAGWAIVAILAASYALCWLVERALRQVWRR